MSRRRDTSSLSVWAVWVPRLLALIGGVTLLLLQAGYFSAPSSLRSLSWRGSTVSLPAVARVPALGDSATPLSHARRSNPTGECSQNPLLVGCRAWRDVVLARERIDIVLVANELFQQFPLTGYGGIETSVENIAAALFRLGIPFWVVTPGRSPPIPEYPFDVLETASAANGRGGFVDSFVRDARAIMAARASSQNGPLRLLEKAHALVGSAPDVHGRNRSIVVWGQSEWSQRFADLSRATITSHHDGGGPQSDHWDNMFVNVGHRFLSFNQRERWVHENDPVFGNAQFGRTRIVPHGLPPADFHICADGGYFLWVASLDWGWIEKGLDIFTDLARKRPELRFVAYGVAVRRHDLVDRLNELAAELPNFEFRGQLKRGAEHQRVFCEATAFFFPTHFSIGESFGMTVIESLSKGVPVIASTWGAPAEILDVPNRRGMSPYGAACETFEEYEAALNMCVARLTTGSAVRAHAVHI